PTNLDLGEVENIIDESKQLPGRAEHAVERLRVLLECFRILAQHLAHADNGVERGAQRVAHIGEKPRGSPARAAGFRSKSRTFSIGIMAWSAKVVTNSICLSVTGRG